MIALVLVYCLSSQPTHCVERREPLGPEASAMQCTMSAQIVAQEYVDEHPTYRLSAWRCEVNKPEQRPA